MLFTRDITITVRHIAECSMPSIRQFKIRTIYKKYFKDNYFLVRFFNSLNFGAKKSCKYYLMSTFSKFNSVVQFIIINYL